MRIRKGLKFYKIYLLASALGKNVLEEEDILVRKCEVKDERYHRFQYMEFNDTGFVCSWSDNDKFGNVVASRYGKSVMMEKLDIPLAMEKIVAQSKRQIGVYEEKMARERKWLEQIGSVDWSTCHWWKDL